MATKINKNPIKFKTKALTLDSLRCKLEQASILPLKYFSVAEWSKNKTLVLQEIAYDFGGASLAVRSSCLREDTSQSSKAGAFLSLLNVSCDGLENSIDSVIASYGKCAPEDQVLIQPMLKNVNLSGVAFSHDPNTLAPYRVINWHEGADTAAVTSGKCGRTWYQAAGSPLPAKKEIEPVVLLIEELLYIFGQVPLDLEFAITQNKGNFELWLLQVRPLVNLDNVESEESQKKRLEVVCSAIDNAMRPHPFLCGENTIFAVMPDWNPAEIIGIRPRPLALSLYRELVTDAVWAYQRNNYGYRNLRSFPLMKDFFGIPYIDLRVSFNSFVPAELDDELSDKLVNYYLSKLHGEPILHDKVEFDVVYSCYAFNLSESLDVLKEHGFSLNEIERIEDSLIKITRDVVKKDRSLLMQDIEKLSKLRDRYEILIESEVTLIEKIYWLLEDTKRYGTLPFAGLARAGFIAIQMLNSLVMVGILSPEDRDAFLSEVSTVSGEMTEEKHTLSKTQFLKKYGHLRPGTYDILSSRYDESPEKYFQWTDKEEKKKGMDERFALSLVQLSEIDRLLQASRLEIDVIELFDFFHKAIKMRELSKFYFTKNLSDILSLISDYGEQFGLSKDQMSFSNISLFKDTYVSSSDFESELRFWIEKGEKRFCEASKLSLPSVILSPSDVWGYEIQDSSPNFITQKSVEGVACSADTDESLSGSIVCIPNADPGYDWIFSRNISGLITAWGGVNSHMAIRAGEMSIPSAIGCGEKLYSRLSRAKKIRINCAERIVEELV